MSHAPIPSGSSVVTGAEIPHLPFPSTTPMLEPDSRIGPSVADATSVVTSSVKHPVASCCGSVPPDDASLGTTKRGGAGAPHADPVPIVNRIAPASATASVRTGRRPALPSPLFVSISFLLVSSVGSPRIPLQTYGQTG